MRYIITYYKDSGENQQTTVMGTEALQVLLTVLLSSGYSIVNVE